MTDRKVPKVYPCCNDKWHEHIPMLRLDDVVEFAEERERDARSESNSLFGSGKDQAGWYEKGRADGFKYLAAKLREVK